MQGFKILAALCAFVCLASAFDGKIGVPRPQKKNVCLNKKDGELMAVSGSCTKFIVCVNGLPVEQSCGKYHFNEKMMICDLPDRAGCSSPNLPLATAAPLKPVEEKEVIIPSPTLPPCFAVANGISLPVPGNQRQYYFCMNNKAYLKDCGNMYFDPKFSACAVKPGTSDSSVIVSPTKAPSNEQSVCFGKPNGLSLPVPGNPRQFNFCQNNKAFLKDCGNKMVFVPKYSACALESDEAYPVEELEQTNHFQNMTRKLCKNKLFGTRLSFPGHCSLYVICTFNNGFVKTCGWREFNSRTASCDLPENVKCQSHNQKTTAKKPEIISTPKPTISPLADRICLNENDGVFIAAPGVCSDFFFCIKGKGYRKSCGKDRHFNPKSMICVDLKHSRCVDIKSIKKSQRSILPRADVNCANKENGTLFTSSNSCGKFNICDNGNAVEMDCPAGLYFNANDNVCDYPTNVQCAL